MQPILFLILVIIPSVFIGLTWIISIFWLIHLSMIRGDDKEYGYGNYRSFKKQFEIAPVIWYNKNFKDGLYAKDVFTNDESYSDPMYSQYKIHASIFTFEGKNMMIRNPWSYALVSLYIFKYIRKLKSKPKVKRFKW